MLPTPDDHKLEPFIRWLERYPVTDNALADTPKEVQSGPLLGPSGRLAISSDANLQRFYPIPTIDPDDASRRLDIAREIDRCMIALIDERPELFLFGCYSHIAALINDYLFELSDENFPARSTACQTLIRQLYTILNENRSQIRQAITARILAIKQDPLSYRPNLGGLIDHLKRVTGHKLDFDLFEEDVIYLDVPSTYRDNFGRSTTRDSHYRIRWQREPLYWAYTFFESPKALRTDDATRESHDCEFPYLCLGEQSETVIQTYCDEIGRYVATLMHLFGNPSVKDGPDLQALLEDGPPKFPGQHLSTAHYAFVPLGVLVFFLYFPASSMSLANEYIGSVRKFPDGADVPHTVNQMATYFVRAVRSLYSNDDYAEFVSVLEKNGMTSLAAACRKSILGQGDETPLPLPNILTLGWRIFRNLDQDKTSRIGSIIARLCADMWQVLRHSPLSQQTTHITRNYQDYIACFVEDHRRIYFTNFQPLGPDRSTKTMFVDLALTGFQRAQLAQRLTDISTYRNISLKDIDRVRAMFWGLNEISIELNSLHQQKTPIYGGKDYAEEERACVNFIKALDEIQQHMDQMNQFIVYGMKGRYL